MGVLLRVLRLGSSQGAGKAVIRTDSVREALLRAKTENPVLVKECCLDVADSDGSEGAQIHARQPRVEALLRKPLETLEG